MLTTVVLLAGGGALFVLLVVFSTLVSDAVRHGVPVTKLGVWLSATRHGYLDAGTPVTEEPSASASATAAG